MPSERAAGYDDLLDAVDDGRGYYLACTEGHGSLPPRRVCPECGDDTLSEEPLPETGAVETYTQVHVPGPRFDGETPVVAIADFGPVRLTGRVQAEVADVEVGVRVSPTVATSKAGERHLALEPSERR
ncbi:hypothetical protein SAMN04487949_3739 [Halogranum gelatinilyticum]|uniref:ChsH2 C-terminal OB-fold domain-containing protein n=1 Tax=Halogranum gelatinilyticum TaxID=660521 RepID=A0A1G9ZRD1_9EURY|nr:hypothetical protein [Halogranum gelatinilyticum]SDN24152.1 hypothetical protein SAMN04487949_3739 [Halogranum gelatinilyticum]